MTDALKMEPSGPSEYGISEALVAHRISEHEPLEDIKAYDEDLHRYVINTGYAIDNAFHDGAKAERERILKMLREPSEIVFEAVTANAGQFIRRTSTPYSRLLPTRSKPPPHDPRACRPRARFHLARLLLRPARLAVPGRPQRLLRHRRRLWLFSAGPRMYEVRRLRLRRQRRGRSGPRRMPARRERWMTERP